jgi:hypothetical protein
MSAASSQAPQDAEIPSRQTPALYFLYSLRSNFPATEFLDALGYRKLKVYGYAVENEPAVKLLRQNIEKETSLSYLGVLLSSQLLEVPDLVRQTIEECRGLLVKHGHRLETFCVYLDGCLRNPATAGAARKVVAGLGAFVAQHDLSQKTQEIVCNAIAGVVGGVSLQEYDPGTGPYRIEGIFDPNEPATGLFQQLDAEIKSGKIDQRFLYWDVRAALRWQDITDGTAYQTAPHSLNFLRERVGPNGESRVELIANKFVEQVGGDGPLDVSYVNLGVGVGHKDRMIITSLLQSDRVGSVSYFSIDDSFPMIQLTIPNIIKGFRPMKPSERARTRLHYIVAPFENLARVQGYIKEVEEEEASHLEGRRKRVRLISFLGGSLGNFHEAELLLSIQGNLMVSDQDTLLLGVEFIADRKNPTLEANYSDEPMQKFLFGPLQDMGYPKPPATAFSYRTYDSEREENPYSDIPHSRTVVGSVKVDGRSVELFSSSKYEDSSLESTLRSGRYATAEVSPVGPNGGPVRFHIVSAFKGIQDPPLIGKYLLTRQTS